MTALPRGTLTLLFSDIEGSTALLKRLGSSYADALDAQRSILRAAWSANGGVEMGTEGDSFFVVFVTAIAAVEAAVAAQRGLDKHRWPRGEAMRVRIGIHTGSPVPHGDGYIGLDVTRAARIAAAAHGGQIVVSEATAHLVIDLLAEDLELRELGRHQLKDLARPERLYQVGGPGLPADFPPLKALGSASTLPSAATPLVGRDGEVAELTDLVGSTHVRLVSLTGPGGSGKTRLAMELASHLSSRFPDGTYFVALAGVTTPEVMWTTIGEALSVPPADLSPPRLFEHVKHRHLLLVLDNLEQLDGADVVVNELLATAPGLRIVATSRRPLHVAGEHEHQVAPLELPDADVDQSIARSGAVQLFVQQARMVSPRFSLTEDNAADVAAVCRRLDGLPLAIELAAARSKLLGPRALLTRLDQALDMAAAGRQVPRRQQTIRQAIDWSYELLELDLQKFFRHLGIFAGGADLDAIAAITCGDHGDDRGGRTDALDLVAELVDASLVTVTETADGEPRVRLLETIRQFARDKLAEAGELEGAQRRHANAYLEVAEELSPLVVSDHPLGARARLEIEHDNLRAALDWAVQPAGTQPGNAAERARLASRMCSALLDFWINGGFHREARQWLERTVELAGGKESPELAWCLQALGAVSRMLGEPEEAHRRVTQSLDMWRRLDQPSKLARALDTIAVMELEQGRAGEARALLEEGLAIARACGDPQTQRLLLGELATLESAEHNDERALELFGDVLANARKDGAARDVLNTQHNIAYNLLQLGRAEDAWATMQAIIGEVMDLHEQNWLVTLAEDCAAIVARRGDHLLAVRLLGAADARHASLGTARWRWQDEWVQDTVARTREALSTPEWEAAYAEGRGVPVEEALEQLAPRPAGVKAGVTQP